MHRFRCPVPLLSTLGVVVLLGGACPLSTFARQTPSVHSSTLDVHSKRRHRRHTSDMETTGKKPAPLPVEPGRLGVRMKLGDGKQTWHPMRKQIGVSYAQGNDQSTVGQFRFVVDRRKLRNYLNRIAPYVRRSPKDAKVIVTVPNATDDGTTQVPAMVVPGYDGAVLNVDAAVDKIQQTVQADPSTTHIVLPVKTKPAKITTKDLEGINCRVGYFVTHFNPGDEGRTATVRRAISIIDGTVVAPGATFSIDKTVGPRDRAHGFWGMGHVFVDGHMELQSGGGMCQVATTVFNAAMMANLKITERHQHVRTVPYVDPGRDSTIYHGQKDFQFVNDTGAPIYIRYFTTGSHAICGLYGKAVPGRKVRLVSHYRRLGSRHYTGVFYRIVSYPDGTKQRSTPFYSDYDWPPTLDYSR